MKHSTLIKQQSTVNYSVIQLLSYSIILLLFFALPLKAQVTVGSQDPPQSFSILELTTKTKDGGLRLPQLTTDERLALNAELKADDDAKGLVIYDTDLDCLEFWNGEGWISLCTDKLVDCSTVTYPVLKESYDFLTGATIANLIADIGGNVQLYDAPTDGNLYDNPSTLLVAGRTYYVEQRVSNCSRRVPVAVTISTAAVSGSATIDACVSAMYDFQYQTLTAYNAANAAIWQWYAKRRGEADSEYKPIPAATAVSYKIPANFVKNVFRTMKSESGTDYNDSVVFQVKVSNALRIEVKSDTLDMEFIDTYGKDYAELKAPPSITGNPNTGGVIKVAYLSLGQDRDPDRTQNACDFGDLYQWGRWRDGHEKITWTKATVGGNIDWDTATKDNKIDVNSFPATDFNNTPTVSNPEGGTTTWQISNSSLAYGKFIYGNNSWNTAKDLIQDFWATQTSPYTKTSNDPCPSGWHVPTRFEFGAIFQGTPTDGNPSIVTPQNNKWTWRGGTNVSILNRIVGGYIVTYGDGSDKSRRIFLPAPFPRNFSDGTLYNTAGSFGSYWSSTYYTITANAQLLYFDSGIVGANANSPKAFGFNVRCVKE